MENAKTSYRTKQQDLLLAYLKSTRGRHFTVEEVRAHFASAQAAIGVATIYRHLEKLVAEGTVNKYIIDENSAACFEYTGCCDCGADEQHFHLKCESCGRLIHLECDELALIRDHLQKEHGFVLNPLRTVFYGKCADCAASKQEE